MLRSIPNVPIFLFEASRMKEAMLEIMMFGLLLR